MFTEYGSALLPTALLFSQLPLLCLISSFLENLVESVPCPGLFSTVPFPSLLLFAVAACSPGVSIPGPACPCSPGVARPVPGPCLSLPLLGLCSLLDWTLSRPVLLGGLLCSVLCFSHSRTLSRSVLLGGFSAGHLSFLDPTLSRSVLLGSFSALSSKSLSLCWTSVFSLLVPVAVFLSFQQ